MNKWVDWLGINPFSTGIKERFENLIMEDWYAFMIPRRRKIFGRHVAEIKEQWRRIVQIWVERFFLCEWSLLALVSTPVMWALQQSQQKWGLDLYQLWLKLLNQITRAVNHCVANFFEKRPELQSRKDDLETCSFVSLVISHLSWILPGCVCGLCLFLSLSSLWIIHMILLP